MNEKRTCKRNIKLQSFPERNIKLLSFLESPQGLVSKDVLPKFAPNPTSLLLGELAGFTASPQIPFSFREDAVAAALFALLISLPSFDY